MYRCRSIINTQPTALVHTTLVPESGDSIAYLVQLEIWALEQKYKKFPITAESVFAYKGEILIYHRCTKHLSGMPNTGYRLSTSSSSEIPEKNRSRKRFSFEKVFQLHCTSKNAHECSCGLLNRTQFTFSKCVYLILSGCRISV